MIELVVMLGMIILLPLIIRSYEWIYKKLSLLKAVGAFFQDLFVSLEIVLIGTFFESKGAFFLLFSIYQVLLLLEVFLVRSIGIRLRLEHLGWIQRGKHFFDSIVDMGFYTFSFLALIVSLYAIFVTEMLPQHFSFFFLNATFFSFIFAFLGKEWINPVFRFQLLPWLKQEIKMIKPLECPYCLKPQYESYIPLMADFPLLRYTRGYFGEKAFDVDLLAGEKPNIVIIMLESFGAQYVGALKDRRGVTPYFDRLCEKGILFERFYSSGQSSYPALVSLLTGLLPYMESDGLETDFSSIPMRCFSEIMSEYQYECTYLSGASLSFQNTKKFLDKHAFKSVIGKEELLLSNPNLPSTSWGIHDPYVYKKAYELLKEGERFKKSQLQIITTISSHHPWILPEKEPLSLSIKEENKELERYLQSIQYADKALFDFVEKVNKDSLGKKTLFFILADHGQPMDEHQNKIVHEGIYEENSHIPLLILGKERTKKERLSMLGSTVDLFPTILDLLGLKGVHHGVGSSLLRKNPYKSIYLGNYGLKRSVGMISNDFKLIDEALFNLHNDPLERLNIALEEKERFTEMKAENEEVVHFIESLMKNKKVCFDQTSYLDFSGELLCDDTFIEKMSQHETIFSLNLSKQLKLTDRGFVFLLQKAKFLKHLDLSETQITDDIFIKLIEKFEDLESLNLKDTLLLTETSFEALFKLKKLKKLDLTGTEISSQALTELSSEKRVLEELILVRTQLAKSHDFIELFEALPRLKSLHTDMPLLDKDIETLSNTSPFLYELKLFDGSFLTDNGIESLAKLNLQILTLQNIPHVTDLGMSFFVDIPLRRLTIQNAKMISDQGLLNLRKLHLHQLHLEEIDCMTDNALFYLSSLPLHELTLCRLHQITDRGIEYLKKLHVIDIIFLLQLPRVSSQATLVLQRHLSNQGFVFSKAA